ncbi:MAG: DUF1573 domain-containing protein [Chloroflexi bacterium]|nr:MAG: DUF1573 domain-containing protein [Chloroflexota bacterium]
MAIKRSLPYWPYLAALLGLAALAVILLLGGRARPASGAPVEVVNDRPLFAEHRIPEGANNRAAEGGQARVELPVGFYDFGAVAANSVARRDFLVINRGSGPLVIQKAYTTCDCTTAEISASVIPPGKASRVTVIFDAGFHPVAGQTVRRGVVLETNDPSRPEVEIWVQARVR